MKKALRYVLMGLGGIVVLVLGFLGFVAIRGIPKYDRPKVELKVDVTPEKAANGRRLASSMCVNCHRDPETGKLTGRVIHDIPPVFGKFVSRNITADKSKGVGSWTDAQLATVIRTGIQPDGSFSPIMGGTAGISDGDLEDLIAWLRAGENEVAPTAVDPPGKSAPSFLVKVLTNTAVKPRPYPSKPIPRLAATDPVAFGKYLLTERHECFGCHSEDFASTNAEFPEKTPGYFGGGNKLIALDGSDLYTANLTPDEATGIGSWTKEQFRTALLKGIGPNGKALRAPMGQFIGLTEVEADAMYAYLRTIPKISKAVDRRYAQAPAGDPGKAAYVVHACNSCHGTDGVGYFSLKRVNEHFSDDEALKAYISKAQTKEPLAAMPVYEGIIKAEEWGPLITYTRSFSAKR